MGTLSTTTLTVLCVSLLMFWLLVELADAVRERAAHSVACRVVPGVVSATDAQCAFR